MCGVAEALIFGGITAATMGVKGYEVSQANKQLDYNAAVAERNAQRAEEEARQVEISGTKEEARYRTKLTLLKGGQRAAYAASGVEVDSGSAEDVAKSTTQLGEEDIRQMRENVALEAYGIRQQRGDLISQAQYLRSQRQSVGLAMATSLLTQGSELGMMFASRKPISGTRSAAGMGA